MACFGKPSFHWLNATFVLRVVSIGPSHPLGLKRFRRMPSALGSDIFQERMPPRAKVSCYGKPSFHWLNATFALRVVGPSHPQGLKRFRRMPLALGSNSFHKRMPPRAKVSCYGKPSFQWPNATFALRVVSTGPSHPLGLKCFR